MNQIAKNRFPDLVGQEDVKRKLDFYLDAQEATQTFPFTLFHGPRGNGKTEFARATCKNIKNKDGDNREFVEINAGTIKNAQQFFEQVFVPVIQNNEISVVIDEVHALPKDLMTVFLTAFNTEKGHSKEVFWRDAYYNFDFKKQAYIFATTEADKLFPPFKDRLLTIDFVPYSVDEVGRIIKLIAPTVKFEDDILPDVAETVRSNARSAVQRAKQILLYNAATHKNEFGSKDWNSLKSRVGIRPLGLSNIEVEILRTLKARGDCSLQMLSAVTGMSRSALQRDCEVYLLQKGLMKIDGQRKLTAEGSNILKKIG
jgi:Holliday junction resolvasome RuvABC ATP-dependent DNA helicase subunit